MPIVQEIAALIGAALDADIGSAAAVSVGDGGVEVERWVQGVTQRVPTRGVAIDNRTPFDLASLTKPMATAALAMVLVGDGALELDAPVRRWFPDAATIGTVRQLLGHAAGCAAHVEFFRELRTGVHPDPRAELVAQAARHPVTAPGVAAVYSDLGYLVLGAIVERAAGAPLDEAFRSRVAEPLDLDGARYPGAAALPLAVATELDDRGLVAGRARGRWRAEVVQRFVTDAPVPGATWRLGWDTPAAALGASHAGDRWPRAGAIGHTGFTGTSLWLDLPHRRWVALLTNRVHPTRHGTADAIKALRRSVGDAVVARLGDH